MVLIWCLITLQIMLCCLVLTGLCFAFKNKIRHEYQDSLYTFLAHELPKPVYKVLARRRISLIRQQLPQSLNILANLLESGYTVGSALKVLGDEAEVPLCDELKQVSAQMRVGISFPSALDNFYKRVPLAELIPTLNLLTIAYYSGGSQAPLVRKHARIIQQQFRSEQKAMSMSAQGRMQGWVMTALPIVMTMVLFAMDSAAMRRLFSIKEGMYFIVVTLTLLVMGQIIIQRIMKSSTRP